MPDSPIKKFLEAGAQFSDVSRKQAESLVKNLVKAGEMSRKDAEEFVQTLVERGRERSERISATIQREVAKQVDAMKVQFEEVQQRVEQLARQVQGNAAPPATKKPAAKKPAAKPAAKKKPPAKKKAPAKKKSPASKKPATKTAPATKAVGSSGVRKVGTTRQA